MLTDDLVKGCVYRGQKYNLLLFKENLLASTTENLYISPNDPWLYLGQKKQKLNIWYFHVLGPKGDGWIPLVDCDIKALRKIC